ncbi:MAG: hypothetical protein IT299_13995 [Dehalococcoidia bacterium]|nr:hypothetical protein [Dehalococcoidia bacterium]
MSEDPEPLDHASLASELRDARAALLELLRTLPESRAYRATERAGWTLKHELAALGAADAELVHVLEELRRRSGTLTLELRRRRAESMHSLQNLRLTPLIERLEAGGAAAAESVAAYGHHLARAVHVEQAAEGATPASASALAHAYRARVTAAIETLRGALDR